MKKSLKASSFRRAVSLLLSLCTTASLVAAAVPQPAAFDSVGAASKLDANENYDVIGTAPVAEPDELTKEKMEDMNFHVDFAPNHYVGARYMSRSTVFYPDSDEPEKGQRVNGNYYLGSWYYRSIRWFEYVETGTEIDPMKPYKETEDRANKYWTTSWKNYPERYDSGKTTILPDVDAWHQVTAVEGENRLRIENKHETEGSETDHNHSYCTGFTTVPMRLYFTVPANTTYRVTVKFSAWSRCCGESSLALIDSFPSLQSSDVSPSNGSSVVSNSVKLKYNQFADSLSESGCILAYDMVPTTGNFEYDDPGKSQTNYLDIQLENTGDSEVTFLRCYYLVITQCSDYEHEANTAMWSGYTSELTISVADLHYKKDAEQIQEIGTAEKAYGELTEGKMTVSIGSRSNAFDGNSLNYGMFSEFDGGKSSDYYMGYYGDTDNRPLSIAYQVPSHGQKLGSVSLDDTKIAVSYPGVVSKSAVAYTQICIPIKIEYEAQPSTIATVTYNFNYYVPDPMGGEWCIGIIDSPSNDYLSSTQADISCLNGSVPAYYYQNAQVKINGDATNRLSSMAYYITGKNDDIPTLLEWKNEKFTLTQITREMLALSQARKGVDYQDYSREICSFSKEKGYVSGVSRDTSKTFIFDNSSSDSTTVFERYFVLYCVREVFTNDYASVGNNLYDVGFYTNITYSVDQQRVIKNEDVIAATYLSWENSDTMFLLNGLEEVSDYDPATAQGWYRFIMRVDNSTTDYAGTEHTGYGNMTFTGQVSENGYTSVQPYFVHPLGCYLKYAWLFNGTTSQPGADGYDLARPLAWIGPQKLVASPVKNNDGSYSLPIKPETEITKETYQAWYIKAADDYGGFYLAMEGTDGKRHLLCHNVTCEGNTGVEHTLCFVTAAEYEAYPELYQTAYAWPITYNAATNLSENNVGKHKYKGFWQKTVDENAGSIITEENLRDEAFRFPVKNNLVWHSVNKGDGSFYGFYSMIEVQDITDPSFKNEEYSLYTYYQTYKDKTGTVDQQILAEYATEIQHCLTIFKEQPTTYFGVSSNWYSGTDHLILKQQYNMNELFQMKLSLGTYMYDYTPTYTITVGKGQTYEISAMTTISGSQELIVEKGGTLKITGTLINEGRLTCYGTVQIENGGCLRDNADSTSGTYTFVGGMLIISTNGMFRQTIAGTGTGWTSFLGGSTIYNDGLLVAPNGITLDASTLDNGVNGVVLTGCTLRASSDVYTARELALTFPRGVPDGIDKYNLVAKILTCYGTHNFLRYPKQADRTDAVANNLRMYNCSVLRNNGAVYMPSGIDVFDSGSGKNVIIGSNALMDYKFMVSGDYTDESGTLKQFSHEDMASLGFFPKRAISNNCDEANYFNIYYKNEIHFGSTTYFHIGVQTVEEALAAGVTDLSSWAEEYEEASEIKENSSSGGC